MNSRCGCAVGFDFDVHMNGPSKFLGTVYVLIGCTRFFFMPSHLSTEFILDAVVIDKH